MDGKNCTKCGAWKDFAEFRTRTKKGRTFYNSSCRECERQYSREWGRNEKRKKEISPVVLLAEGKICPKCDTWKLYSEFYANQYTLDGYLGICKNCSIKSSRNWQINNPEQHSENKENYRKNNAEEISDYNKTWKKNNPILVKAHKEKWESENPQKVRQIHQNWIDRNPQKPRVYYKRWVSKPQSKHIRALAQLKRQALKRNAICTLTVEQWDWMIAVCGGKCLKCGSDEPITCDHVIPLIRGGSHTLFNVQPLCLSCNIRKFVTAIDYRPIWLRKFVTVGVDEFWLSLAKVLT